MPAMTEAKPDLLTTAEAAAMLGISSMTLRRWADDGKIRVIKLLSGQRRFELEEIQKRRRDMGMTD